MIHAGILTKELDKVGVNTKRHDPAQLIVWNDEVNTFQWVIESLVEICEHSHTQAEQCAWLIHSKGKYAVKGGDKPTLQPMREALSDRGIGATVEQ